MSAWPHPTAVHGLNPRQYNDPFNHDGQGAVPASIDQNTGKQLSEFYWQKMALIEAAKEQYFGQLADVTTMPKHMGKKIVRYHYIPLLDDENVNDQGIDASGAVIADGNLYGSSKDVGKIQSKLPALSENGGRVNRVGFSRKTIEGTFDKFGFFQEYTRDSIEYDSDTELMAHIQRELIMGANEITEDALQIDLLNAAGVIKFGGEATQVSEITGEAGTESLMTYEGLMRLSIELDDNRTPKYTTYISGSRMIDTKTISSARVMYIGSELIPSIRKMTDLFGNPAFIPVEKYAAAGTILRGEIGCIDQFRFVVVPEMMHWSGVGASVVDAAPRYRNDGTKYNVYPMLCVGTGAFTTIGFATDGKSTKFVTYSRKPGEQAVDRHDPYGETGFSSIKWHYGFMSLRPERIALCKVVAEI